MISIVRGNDFTLKIPLEKLIIENNNQVVAPFYPEGCELCVYIKNDWCKTKADYSISDNVVTVNIDGRSIRNGVYSVEIIATKQGRNMRSMSTGQFRIVDTNKEASFPQQVEFGMEAHILESQVFIPFSNDGAFGTSDYNQLGNQPKINNVTLSGNKSLDELGIQPKGDYVSDPNYVHTDFNFTQKLKNRLESLHNYDDTIIQSEVAKLEQSLNKLVGGQVNGVIDAFNEIEAFLSGITESNSLTKMLSDLRANLLSEIDKKANASDLPSLTGYATQDYVTNQIAESLGMVSAKLDEINGEVI